MNKSLVIAYVMGDQFIGLDWMDGSAIHVHEIVEALRKIGNHVSLITYWRTPYTPGHVVDVVKKQKLAWLPLREHLLKIYSFLYSRLWNLLWGNWKTIWRGLSISREIYQKIMLSSEKWDIVHERLAPISLGGILAARHFNIPYVLEVNAQILEEQAAYAHLGAIYSIVGSTILNYTFKRADAVVAVSRELALFYTKKYKLPPEKVFILPNGVNGEKFSFTFDKIVVMQKYQIPPDKSIVIMFVGNFKPWHGLQVLIDAFALVLAKIPDAQLVIVGDGQARGYLEEQCIKKNIDSSVLFTGFIPHSDIPEILAIADIGVVPLLPDPIRTGAMKVFEYMASGIAVVASNLSQIYEVLDGGQLGILVEPGNVEQLAQSIIELACDPDKMRSMGKKAREVVLHKHTWAANAHRLNNIYWDCMTLQ